MLANLFLHYVFDVWVEKHWGGIQFERYADDIVCHCSSKREARRLKQLLEERFSQCGLQLHPEKTKIVYCKGGYHTGNYEHVSFDFLGYTFRPCWIKTRQGKQGLYFIAAVSQKAAKRIRNEINSWLWKYWYQKELTDIRSYSMNRLRGWLNYYGLFGSSIIRGIIPLRQAFESMGEIEIQTAQDPDAGSPLDQPVKEGKAARFPALEHCLDDRKVGQEEPYEVRVSRTVR